LSLSKAPVHRIAIDAEPSGRRARRLTRRRHGVRVDAGGQARKAALTARLWPATYHILPGRADFHGHRVDRAAYCA